MEIAALGLRVDGVDNIGKASQSLDDLKKSARGAEGSLDSLSGDATKATKSIKAVGDQSDRTSGRFSALGGAAKAAGGVLAAALSVAAVSGGIKASLRTYADFESQMAKVGAVSRASEKDFKALTETAKRLGAETEFSASQAGAGLEFLARAGWSARESIAAMPAVLNLATSASMDLGKAADVASNIMSAFGIAATDAADVADILAAATSRANTDVAQLGDAMGYVGPIAASLKISMGDTAAAIGALSDAGIQGSSAGTGLRRVLSSLANPTKASADEIRSLGISMSDVNPQANNLADIIDTLAKGGIDAASAMKIFGDQGGPALLALVEQRSKVRELAETLGDVSGEAQRMAETIGDTLEGDLKGLSSAAEGVRISLGEAFSDAARKSVQSATTAVRAFGENISTVLATITLAAKLTTAYVVAVYAIPAAKAAATVATTAYQAVLAAFSAQVAMTTTQLLTMRTALNVLAAGFAGWQIGTYLRNEFEIVEKAGIALMGGLHTVAATIAGEFAIMGELVKFALTNPFDFARGVIADFFGWIAGLGKSALKLIGFEDLAAGIDTEFKGIRGAVGSEHAAMLKEMRATTQTEIAGIKDVYAEMFADVGKGAADASGAIDETKKKTEELGSGIKKVSSGAASAVGATSKAFSDLMARLFPAQAAQAKYNAELAILKKHLSGNQLARAVSKLTKEFTGGDADGAAKAIKEYNKNLKTLVDRLNPAAVAARTFKDEQKLLTDAIKRTGDPTGELARSLEELERQYRETSRVTNEWTKWTESALDRVDSAFADAWRNIGDGFKGFRDNLTNAFKQMLAELAHMAITKPIVMQIGSMLGIGGGTQGNNGIWGSLLGGGSGSGGGGMNWGSLATMGKNIYSIYSGITGVGQAVLTGWQSGGLSGAISGGAGYYGNLASSAINSISGMFGGQVAGAVGGQLAGAASGAASGAAANVGYGLGQSMVAGQIGNAAYAGASAGASAAASGGGFLSGLSSMATNPVGWAVAAAVSAYSGFNSYRAGIRPDADSTRSHGGAWATGYQPIIEYYGAINKLTDTLGLGGTFLGSIMNAPGAFWQSIGGSLFGSGERFKRTVGSATGYYGDEGYVSTGPSATWHPGSRKFGAEHDAALDDLNNAFVTTIGSLFDAFGVDSTIATTTRTRLRRTSGRMVGDFITEIDGQVTNRFRQYSKNGKLGEAMEQFSDDIMGEYLAKAIVGSNLPEYFRKQFEPLAADRKVTAEQVAETLSEIFARFDGVNAALEIVNMTALELTDSGMRASDALIAMSGGLESLVASTSVYYDNFFSAEEKITDTIDSITRAFENANIPLADSREAYRAMVEDIDVTTEAGQQMFATMMGLAGQAAQYYSIVEQQAAASLNASFGALQRSIAAQQKRVQDAHFARIGSLNDMAATASASISALTSIGNSLDAAVRRLRGTSDDATRSLRAQAVMTLNSALVSARSGRSLAGFDGLQDALDVASQMDTKLYSSLVDFEREQGRTANLIAELEKVNGKQLSAEERLLKAVQDQISAAERQFESQMARLDAQLAYAQSQLDELNGIDNSVMSVASAVAAMNASVVAAVNGLSRELSRVSSQANSPANNPSIPGFSSGGIASGPMSGYPVELHGTEAVIPLNGSSIPLSVPGIKALVHEVSELRKELAASQRAIAEHTSKSARVLEREEMERRQEEVA